MNDADTSDITSGAPEISIITTCKGRLHHLRHTLANMLCQECSVEHEVIVVDYGCPDETFEWCKAIGSDRLVALRAHGVPEEFNRSHSKNVGAQLARGRIFAFVDADMRLHSRWLEAASNPIRCNSAEFVTVNTLGHDGWDRGGTCAVARSLFERVRGYDEKAHGWGAEDADFYHRCGAVAASGSFPANLLKPIKHGHDERVRFHAEKDIGTSCNANQQRMACRAETVNPGGWGLAEIEVYRGSDASLPAVSWWNGQRLRQRIRSRK